ncbi:COG1233 Phytoene dehydrogenase and related proteins [Candidatus Nanopelagicaceae bacterium]
MSANKKRVAVIGAGMGGMCTAARLAKTGYEVTVFESSDRHGGKCRTEWIGNYAFDTGPSLLTLPAVYRDFFQRTGDVMGRVVELQPVSPSFDYRFADGSAVRFANLSRKETLAAIEKSFGSEPAQEWDQIMRQAEAMWDVSREPFIESELRSVLSLLKRPTLLRDLKIIAPWKTLRDFKLKDARLRNILDRYATYSGSDPRVAPAVLASIAFVEEAFGAWHIKGGIGKLGDAVYQRCLDRGVKFEFNTQVTQINHDGKSTTGITLADGRVLDYSIVVANADSSTVYNKLITGKVKKLRRERANLAKADPSLAGFSLLLGLRPTETPTGLSHHNIFFPENYDAEFVDIFDRQQPVQDPTIYLCAPQDGSMVRHPGHEAWFVLVNAPRHDETGNEGFNWNDADFNHRYAMQIISSLEARGISIRDRLEVMEFRTPADLERTVAAPGGAIYGTSSNGARSAFMRAKNRSPLKGLYCVGGSAHPGGGLPLVGLSAEIVAQAIVGKTNH